MQNILIVDDLIVNRNLIRKILINSQKDVAIYEAVNGVEVLDMINKMEFSVIILDVMLPDINGIDILSKIKSSPNLKDTGVIMCSAINEIESIEKALELGALDYLTKPLTAEQIRVTLPLKVKNALRYFAQNKQLITYNNLIKNEMILAEEIQKSMILGFKESLQIKVFSKYTPCSEIGGDMFAAKEVGGKSWFIMADVSGHGVASAMTSVVLKVAFNSIVNTSKSPSMVLEAINTEMFEVFLGGNPPILSAFVGCVEEGKLFFSNAGHPYPVIYKSKSKKIFMLEEPGYLIGLFQKAEYTTNEIILEKDDFIMLYTDGLIDGGKIYDTVEEIDLIKYCDGHKEKIGENPEQFISDIMEYYSQKEENGFEDDVAVMLIQKK